MKIDFLEGHWAQAFYQLIPSGGFVFEYFSVQASFAHSGYFECALFFARAFTKHEVNVPNE